LTLKDQTGGHLTQPGVSSDCPLCHWPQTSCAITSWV